MNIEMVQEVDAVKVMAIDQFHRDVESSSLPHVVNDWV